jgi:hypothetical protein
MKVGVFGVPCTAKEITLVFARYSPTARVCTRRMPNGPRLREQQKPILSRKAIVVRVEIEPEEFAAWCSAGNVALEAEARMRYANEFAYLDKRFGDAQEASRAFNLAWSQWSVGPSASIVDTSNDCLATALCRPWSSA